MNETRDFRAVVLEKLQFSDELFMIRVLPEEDFSTPLPGQFYLLKSWEGFDPLLSRPFAPVAVHGNGALDFIIKVVGRGTKIIRSSIEGTKVKLRGPCGNPFPVPSGQRLLLLGGSVGIAPMLFAYKRYKDRVPAKLIIGVPGEEWKNFFESELVSDTNLEIFSDDGSIGRLGTPLTFLSEEGIEADDEVWACGPIGMLKALGNSLMHKVMENQVYVSLEARMACGIGGCLGCVIPTTRGNRRVCADGPVFRMSEVSWNEL